MPIEVRLATISSCKRIPSPRETLTSSGQSIEFSLVNGGCDSYKSLVYPPLERRHSSQLPLEFRPASYLLRTPIL